MASVEVKSYKVTYSAGGKQIGFRYRAVIYLIGNKGTVGILYFHDDPATMPNTDALDSTGVGHCHLPSKDFANTLDLLRNEKPLFFDYVQQWEAGHLTTNIEPVGEGEYL